MPLNPISQAIDKVINLLMDQGVDAAKAWITINAPLFEAPIVDIFTNEVLEALENSLENVSAKLVAAVTNDIETNLENSIAKSATQALNKAQQSGDANAIAQATKNAAAAASALGHFDGQ